MKVAYDSRGAADTRGIGRYVTCLLAGLRETAADGHEIVEAHRPRRVTVFHSPWIDGALLRSPCPMVVTLHDLVPLKRRSEYLRTGLRFRMRYLAARRAARLIVPTRSVARDAIELLNFPDERIDVIPEAASATFRPVPDSAVAAARERYDLPKRYLLWVGGLRAPRPTQARGRVGGRPAAPAPRARRQAPALGE